MPIIPALRRLRQENLEFNKARGATHQDPVSKKQKTL
jgi:hypothetical protein